MFKDPQYVVFRDDDLGFIEYPHAHKVHLRRFMFVHELYNKYNITHEIGYITGDQKSQNDLTEYVKNQNNIVIQFHAHEHCDFTTLSENKIRSQFDSGIKIIEDVFGKRPTKWFPPNHKSNEITAKIAVENGLVPPSEHPISLKHFVENGKRCFRPKNPMTICHHYWSTAQTEHLECALLMYKIYLDEHFRQRDKIKSTQNAS